MNRRCSGWDPPREGAPGAQFSLSRSLRNFETRDRDRRRGLTFEVQIRRAIPDPTRYDEHKDNEAARRREVDESNYANRA